MKSIQEPIFANARVCVHKIHQKGYFVKSTHLSSKTRKTVTFMKFLPKLLEIAVYRIDYHIMWKLRKSTLTLFWQKFRENDVFTNNKITKQLI